MIKKLNKYQSWIKRKIHSLTLGVVLGSGALMFGQSCASTGHCLNCGACVSKLPILAVPILVDGAIVMVEKVKSKKVSEKA